MGIAETAYKLFGKYTRGKKYYQLQDRLRKARMPASADVYAAAALFSAVLAAIGGAVVAVVLGLVLGLDLVLFFLLVMLMTAAFGVLSYYLMLQYPAMTADERKRKIDLALPYMIGFMYAMSRSGATVIDIFRELSKRTDVGELREEMLTFMRDIEYLGRDPLTAMRNLSKTTPSDKFRSFMDVLVSIVETGGDITPYLAGKTTELHAIMKEDNKKTVASMEFFAEFYVILVQFLPLLFLAILIFIGFLPGQSIDLTILSLLAYGWVPIGSIMFAVIIATVPPIDIKGVSRIFKPISPYRTVPLTPGDARDKRVVQKLKGTMMGLKVKRFLSNPFRTMVENPSYALFFSAPAGLFYLIFTPAKTLTVIIMFFIILIPYTIFYELKSMKSTQLETALPDFLKSLSSASKSGLTLSRSMRVASTADLGAMTDEVKRASKDIEWGASANEAFGKLEARVSISPTTTRSLTLIRKASEAEENIADVVDITLDDVRTRREVMGERNSAMFVYKLIIVMSFVVFLVTVFFIVDSYLRLPTGATVGEQQLGAISPIDVKLLFYRMLLVQSIFGGIIAGQMGGTDMRQGMKYAILLTLLTTLMFEAVLMPKVPPPVIPPE
jgi:flagellar protein FlaJ